MSEGITEKRIEPMTIKYPPARENIGRLIGVFIGLAIALLGVAFILSIILIIPGFFGVLIGLVITVLCTPKASATCPACSTENKVALKSKRLKCEGCDTTTPLRWIKP